VLSPAAASQAAALSVFNATDEATPQIKSGTPYRYEARAADNTGRELGVVQPVWSIIYPVDPPSSGRAPVATVDADGVLTAWGSGSVTLRATWGDHTADTVAEVIPDETVSAGWLFPAFLDRRWDSFAIDLNGIRQGDLRVGRTYQLRAYPVRGDRIIYDTPLQPYWLVSYGPTGTSAPRASIDANGTLTVFEAGTFHVGATFANGGTYMMVTVNP
jgi:hypothetical protein